MDAVTADLRVYEAKQDAISRETDRMIDYVCAEVIKSEFRCKPQDISDFWEEDEDFRNEMADALARIVRDPRNQMNLHRVLSAFDHAVERRAEKEYREWRAA